MALADERLEVAAELHAVGRVEVDHLHLPAEGFVSVTASSSPRASRQHHAVHPIVAVFVGAQHLVGDGMLWVAPEFAEEILLLVRLMALERLDNCLRRKPFMNE